MCRSVLSRPPLLTLGVDVASCNELRGVKQTRLRDCVSDITHRDRLGGC